MYYVEEKWKEYDEPIQCWAVKKPIKCWAVKKSTDGNQSETDIIVCICDDEKNAHVIANLLNMNEIRASLP